MSFLPLRTVQNRPQEVDRELIAHPNEPVVVTRNGKPIWVIAAIDEEDLYDYLLANNKAIMDSLDQIDADIASGREVPRPWEELVAELDAEWEALTPEQRAAYEAEADAQGVPK